MYHAPYEFLVGDGKIVDFLQKDRYDINDLLQIMRELRSPDGCPWDREQTHESIRNCLIEETYEAVEAIDTADRDLLEEELGDVLLQVVFHAQLEQEIGSFSFEDVVDGVAKKMIYRHPHVFGQVHVENSQDVLNNWDALKRKSKGQKKQSDALKSVSASLPALLRAAKLQKKAAKVGVGAETAEEAFAQAEQAFELLRERVLERGTEEQKLEAYGSFLFAASGLSRFVNQEPEEALAKACSHFIETFLAMEQLAEKQGVPLLPEQRETLAELWKTVAAQL